MADPVTLGVLGVLGIVALRRSPSTPSESTPPTSLPPDTKGSAVADSGADSLGLKGGVVGAALVGAVVGYQIIHSLDGKVFNASGENRTTSTVAPWVGAAGGAVAGVAIYSAIVGTIGIPVAGEIVLVAAVIVLAVISIMDAVESTVNNARKLELYNQVYAKCAVDPRGAWQIAQDAFTKEGFHGLGFKVGLFALGDGEFVVDSKGNTYNVKETLVAAYCKSRTTGDAFAEVCRQALPWFGYLGSPFKAVCDDNQLNAIRDATKGMTSVSELKPLFDRLYTPPASMRPGGDYYQSPKMFRDRPTIPLSSDTLIDYKTGGKLAR